MHIIKPFSKWLDSLLECDLIKVYTSRIEFYFHFTAQCAIESVTEIIRQRGLCCSCIKGFVGGGLVFDSLRCQVSHCQCQITPFTVSVLLIEFLLQFYEISEIFRRPLGENEHSLSDTGGKISSFSFECCHNFSHLESCHAIVISIKTTQSW